MNGNNGSALGDSGDQQVKTMMDSLQRCRLLWCGEEPGIELPPTPTRPEGPPMCLAGNGARMLRLTGRHFDGWLAFSPTSAEYDDTSRALLRAARTAGPVALTVSQ
jgi:alkanesulfonate monooxygenase SsuD/methylene tetrahydromethanopterin reductase-like flavin-dependent oxidoreductase (luciferase family)